MAAAANSRRSGPIVTAGQFEYLFLSASDD
jgi:hypothetical protein